ncbi:MAG: tetratricopeptide repeat protein, partial [Gammaproteobacteria bacterium]|nr:tetratricopeptide repeat protein [Gammaproteobacteria bacterium]
VQTANADWAAAEQNLQAALTQLGSDDEAGPLRLTALAALVHQYTQLRRNRQAHDALVELLPLQRDRLGSGHPDTIASLVAFADIALRLYRTDEALAAAGEAHATAQAVYGEGHPQLLDSVVTLGRVLWRARRYTEAEQLFRDALRQFEERLDGEHPVVPILEGRLAVLLATSDRLIEAESLYLRALEGHIDLYGERHPDTIRVLKNYASLLSRRGKSDERAAVMARLAGIARSYAEDPGVDPVQLSDMADLLLSVEPEHLRDPELALAMASRAVSESRRQHPSPLLTMGDALLMLGRPAETIDLYEEAATLPDGLRILVIPRRLTSLYAASGETARAEAFLRRHLQRRQDAGVEGELLVAYSMFDLARFLVQQGRADEAESLARDAHQLFKASDSEALWLQARAQALLGATLSGQGRFAEAEETLLQAFEQVRNDSQTQKRVKREIAMWLASLYRDWEQPEQEQSWRALIASHEDAPTYSAW